LSNLKTDQHAEEQILVGKITSAFGIKGWVKIYSHTSPIENIVSYLPWDLKRGSDTWQLDVLEARVHGKGLVARLESIDDRTAAEAMAGAEIYIDRSRLKDLADGEYYWDDLIGLDVTDTEGKHLGKVDSILETGANDVLEIVGEKRQLVPYVVGDVIKSVDIEAGIIQIDWVEPE
jgi:16S rRNA processing protein RimM